MNENQPAHPASAIADLQAKLDDYAAQYKQRTIEKIQAEQERDAMRAKLEAAEAQNKRNDAEINALASERDAARRELAEALEWMRKRLKGGYSDDTYLEGIAILARHEREERRKGERRQKQSLICNPLAELRKPNSDRRQRPATVASCATCGRPFHSGAKPMPESEPPRIASKLLRLQIELEESRAECERLKEDIARVRRLASEDSTELDRRWREATARAEEAEAECERLKGLLESEMQDVASEEYDHRIQMLSEQVDTAIARAEEAEAKLAEKKAKVERLVDVFNNLPTCNGDEVRHKVLLLVREAIRGEYAPPERKPWPETDYPKDVWYEAVQDRIEACEPAIDAMKGAE